MPYFAVKLDPVIAELRGRCDGKTRYQVWTAETLNTIDAGNKSGRYNIGKTIIFLVRLYQKIPHPKMCKFEPSCSAYMILAVEKYGGVKGFFMGIMRIFRCNPFFKGGVDYP